MSGHVSESDFKTSALALEQQANDLTNAVLAAIPDDETWKGLANKRTPDWLNDKSFADTFPLHLKAAIRDYLSIEQMSNPALKEKRQTLSKVERAAEKLSEAISELLLDASLDADIDLKAFQFGGNYKKLIAELDILAEAAKALRQENAAPSGHPLNQAAENLACALARFCLSKNLPGVSSSDDSRFVALLRIILEHLPRDIQRIDYSNLADRALKSTKSTSPASCP